MKRLFCLLMTALFGVVGCNNAQNKLPAGANLAVAEFAEKLKNTPNAQLVDVRTPGEFEKGHLVNALNVDYNGADFDAQIKKLDTKKPVFVYCLSGGRSASALQKMQAAGFEQVYNMNGGIMKWRAANLPETTESANNPKAVKSEGMSLEAYTALTKSAENELIMIDFYADWCAPCKQMRPYLEELNKEWAGKLKVIWVNADDNQSLCKSLNIDALPMLILYKNGVQTWQNSGFIDKNGVLEVLKKQ